MSAEETEKYWKELNSAYLGWTDLKSA